MTALRVARAIAAQVVSATEEVAGIVEKASEEEAQAFTVDKCIDAPRLASAFKGGNQSLVSSGYQTLPGG